MYTKTLSLLQGFPKDATYRHQTEEVVQQRLQIVQAEKNIVNIERKIGCGQIEELIDQVRVCGQIKEHIDQGVIICKGSKCTYVYRQTENCH